MTPTESSSSKDTEAIDDNVDAVIIAVVETAGADEADEADDEEAEDNIAEISKRGNDNKHIVSSSTRHDDYPNNVTTQDQLELLPDCYLSNNKYRPLQLKISNDEIYMYALNPVTYSVLCILIIECLERLAYYGINNTETAFLDGSLNPEWNAGMSSVAAVSYTSASIAIAYTAPFIGGIVADGFLGDYWSIVIGVGIFYLPGLLLILLTTIPYLLGPEFNINVLSAGLLALTPIGTGFIKPIVNVFGAKQFHPLLQSSLVETYYVNFYVAINIGALVGGIAVPIVAQYSLEAAYSIPFVSMFLGYILFLSMSKRFVKRAPEKKALFNTLKIIGLRTACKPFDASKKSNGGLLSDHFVDGVKRLLQIIPVALLILPFNIVYAQMTTVFILQGEAMEEVGIFSASLMSNFDSISVLITGVVTGSLLYPYLDRRGIHFCLTHRFSLGCVFGALSISSALIVDNAIRKQYINNDSQISILWLIFSYAFVGMGEMFAVATSYEAAFTIAPKEQKSLASAIQLFLGNGLANYIQIGLSQALASWFPPTPGTEAYVDSKINYFLYILLGIIIFGIFLNIIPAVKNWVERLRDDALDATALNLAMNSDEFSSTSLGVENNNKHALELEGVDGGHHHPHEAAVASANRDHIEEIAF